MTKLGGLRVDFEGDSKDLDAAAKRAKESLAGVGRQAEATAGKQAKTNKQSKALTGSMGKLSTMSGQTRNSIRNATFQFQDMAVQLQMGTRMSTVLSQQLPQLGMSFGTVGLIAGTLGGITAGLGGALLALGGKSETLAEKVDNLSESMATYKKRVEDAIGETVELETTFSDLSDEAREALGIISETTAARTLIEINDATNTLVDSWRVNGRIVGDAIADAFDLTGMFGWIGVSKEAKAMVVEFGDALLAVQGAGDMETRILAMQNVIVLYGKLSDLNGEVTEEEAAQIVLMGDLVKEMQAFVNLTEASSDEAAELRKNLEASALAMLSIRNLPQGGGGRGGDPRRVDDPAGQTFAEWEAEQRKRLKAQKAAKPRSPLEVDLERLQKNLATETELVQASFDNNAEVLKSAQEQQLISQQEFEELSLRSKKEYTDAMAKLDKTGFKAQIGFAGDFFGLMSGLMSSENKKLFNIGKAAAIGTALINTYKGISESLAKYPMPWAGAMAAAHAAVGFANVQKIRSTTFGGGGGGSSVASAAPAAPPTGGGANTLVNVTLQGDTFGASGVRGLLDQINDVIGDGGRIRLV